MHQLAEATALALDSVGPDYRLGAVEPLRDVEIAVAARDLGQHLPRVAPLVVLAFRSGVRV